MNIERTQSFQEAFLKKQETQELIDSDIFKLILETNNKFQELLSNTFISARENHF
jgi:hypothetical protein